MLQLRPLDPLVPIQQQLGATLAPVVLINVFTVDAKDIVLNCALWESVAHCREAFTHPEFISAPAAYPSSAVAAPHLFAKVAVPNLCTA